MAWDDSPPTKEELSAPAKQSWDATPPTPQELGTAPKSFDENHPTIARYRDAAINSLPAVGAAGGGLMGAGAGGVGAIPGAAFGGAAGVVAKRFAEGVRDQGLSYLTHPSAPTASGTLEGTKELATGAMEGAGQEAGGQLIGKGLSALKTAAKNTAPAISEAASRLGIKPTSGMTNSSPVAQGLESSLSQSPTAAGMAVRSEVDPVREGLKTAAKDVLSGSSGKSSYEAGGEATKGLISDVGEKYNNVQDAYEPFNKELPKMKPDDESKWKLADQISKSGKGNLSLSSDVESFGNKVANKVMDSDSLGDIEEVRKQVSKSLNSAYRSGDYNAVEGISKIEDHLNNFRDDQFQTLATQNGPSSGGEGTKMGSQMVSQYKQAQGTYKDLMSSLKEVGPALGIRTTNPKGFVDALQNMPEEKLANVLSQTKSVRAAQTIQEHFPDTFDAIKQFKLGQIAEKSMSGDEIDPSKLVRESSKLSPEFRQMIFGDKASKLSDIETLVNSLPAKMGPSGTPQGELYNQSWNPGLQGAEAIRYGQREALTNPKFQGLLTPQNIKGAEVGAGALGRGVYNKGKSLLGYDR